MQCFSKEPLFFESFQVLLLKKTLYGLIIPANFTNLTFKTAQCLCCHFCFRLRLPRWRWHVIRL